MKRNLGKMKLNEFCKAELNQRKMDALKGGAECDCHCDCKCTCSCDKLFMEIFHTSTSNSMYKATVGMMAISKSSILGMIEDYYSNNYYG